MDDWPQDQQEPKRHSIELSELENPNADKTGAYFPHLKASQKLLEFGRREKVLHDAEINSLVGSLKEAKNAEDVWAVETQIVRFFKFKSTEDRPIKISFTPGDGDYEVNVE